MNEAVLYHNPRCSKSRAAKQLLEEHGAAFRVVEYLKTPLTRAELAALARKLGRPAAEWVRRGEQAWQQAGLSEHSSDEELLDAIAAHPVLLERPLLVRGERAVVARPPERVLELL